MRLPLRKSVAIFHWFTAVLLANRYIFHQFVSWKFIFNQGVKEKGFFELSNEKADGSPFAFTPWNVNLSKVHISKGKFI